MTRAAGAIRRSLKSLGGFLLSFVAMPVVVLLILFFFFGPAMELVLETWEMAWMRGTVEGRVVEVSVERGNRCGGGPVVEYEYVVDGVSYRSDRLSPGWAGNGGTWSGGGGLANRYTR